MFGGDPFAGFGSMGGMMGGGVGGGSFSSFSSSSSSSGDHSLATINRFDRVKQARSKCWRAKVMLQPQGEAVACKR
jgi:hypothetical protein